MADLAVPAWMEGSALPTDEAGWVRRPDRPVLTDWDSELFGIGVHLRTTTRAGWVATAYLPGTVHDGSEVLRVTPRAGTPTSNASADWLGRVFSSHALTLSGAIDS